VRSTHEWAIVPQLQKAQSRAVVGYSTFGEKCRVTNFLRRTLRQEEGQDVAEYAVLLAVILAIAVGTIRLIGSHAGNVFANVGSAIQ
jgi:Flp pilus assembly pilin Flp